MPGVLNLQLFQQSEVDITMGENPRLPFDYLGLIDISVDGAIQAMPLIQDIQSLHAVEQSADVPATWLYYPISERVGRKGDGFPPMLTLAFANGIWGQEAEFREWYATRHIRHALNIQALVSGQCFQRTIMQFPGSLKVAFDTIAVYGQEGTSQSIIDSFKSIPAEILHFPALDEARFTEAVFERL